MGTLADKLQYLKDTKDAIMNAIIEKGVAITSSDTFRSYADKISSISTNVKESTFTGYIAQEGDTNIIPTVLQPLYGNEFKGLMKINDSYYDKRKFILYSTFNSGTDGTLEAFIHYIHNPSISGDTGIFTVGGVHWKSVYIGTHYYSSTSTVPFIDIGNNGTSWMTEQRFESINLAEQHEIYFKLTINTSSVNIVIYDTDKVTVLHETAFELDTTPIDSTIILLNNWDLNYNGGGYANAGTIDLSDSYIKINDVVVQGLLK